MQLHPATTRTEPGPKLARPREVLEQTVSKNAQLRNRRTFNTTCRHMGRYINHNALIGDQIASCEVSQWSVTTLYPVLATRTTI